MSGAILVLVGRASLTALSDLLLFSQSVLIGNNKFFYFHILHHDMAPKISILGACKSIDRGVRGFYPDPLPPTLEILWSSPALFHRPTG